MIRLKKLIAIVALLGCVPDEGTAQVLEPVGEFYEDLDENATQISGASLAGVQRGEAEFGSGRMLVYLPQGWANRQLCLIVTTANGRYESINDYRLRPEGGNPATTFIPVTFPTAEVTYLSAQGHGGVAAKMTGGPCGEDGHPSALVSWETPEAQVGAGPVDVLISTFGANETYVYFVGEVTPIACSHLAQSNRQGFDMLCPLPADRLAPNLSVEIVRYFDGEPAEPDIFELKLPGG